MLSSGWLVPKRPLTRLRMAPFEREKIRLKVRSKIFLISFNKKPTPFENIICDSVKQYRHDYIINIFSEMSRTF